MSDDWSSFQAFDNDDDLYAIDTAEYAVEDDSQEVKAAVGAARKAPEIDRDAEPIQVPPGTCVCVMLTHQTNHTKRVKCELPSLLIQFLS